MWNSILEGKAESCGEIRCTTLFPIAGLNTSRVARDQKVTTEEMGLFSSNYGRVKLDVYYSEIMGGTLCRRLESRLITTFTGCK